jgi:molybdenum ABC transporter molybdate-binding protein
MTRARQPWGDDWAVGLRIWVERAGRAVLGKGRLELLEGIDRWQSISAAARHMGMSYRRAWRLVQSVNEAAGAPLVEATTGGTHGGGARLTPLGRQAVAVFREVQEQLRQTAAGLLARLVQADDAPAVHVAAAVSLEDVLGQLLADHALRQPAVRVRAVFGASDELAGHVLAGAPTDLFLTADPLQLDRLEAAGLLVATTRTPLAENALAAIGPAGRDVPVRKPAALVRPEVKRVAIAGPTSPLGGYTRRYLEGLGLYEALLPRALTVDNSRAVLAAVAAGQADVGLIYASDAARAADCRLLFRVRRPRPAIRYEAAVVARGGQPEQAAQLLAFLTAPAAATRFRRCGFLPVRAANT